MRRRTRSPARQDRIVEHIRGMIVRGEIAPCERLPSRGDIQRRFGACAATVQRAFDRLVRTGFVSVRSRKGSFVAERPPHLSRYALSFPASITEPDWVRFWTVMEQVARELEEDVPCEMPSYRGVLPGRSDDGYPRLLRDVAERCLAGIVFVTDPRPLRGTPLLEAPGVPRVAILSGEPPPNVLAVDLDAHGFIDRALECLAGRGRRRIAMIVPPGVGQERIERFQRGLARRGMRTAPRWIQAAALAQPKWATNLALVMLSGPRDDRPDGLIVTDDNLVEHAFAGVIAASCRVPDDLDVIAHCNFPAPAPSVLPAQRLGYDVRRILTTCIDLLARARGGRRVRARTVIPPVFEAEASARPSRDGATRPIGLASRGRVG